MRAWLVSNKDGDECEIVLAPTRGKARASAHEMLSYYEWTELRVKRLPEFDNWLNVPTIRDLWEKGWSSFDCSVCGEYVDLDEGCCFDRHGEILCLSCGKERENAGSVIEFIAGY